MLRRNAERIQRDQVDRDQIRQLLAGYSGEELDDAGLEKFFSQLSVETGALPPLNVVLEASRNAASADPVEIGNQVRLYYRRARARVAPRPVAVGQ
jgi:hypothetical protein